MLQHPAAFDHIERVATWPGYPLKRHNDGDASSGSLTHACLEHVGYSASGDHDRVDTEPGE